MMKKLFLVGGGVTLGAVLLFGTSAFSHISHAVSQVQSHVKANVPVEYELDRAKGLIEKTEPEIRRCKKVIATKQVEIKYLKNEIAQMEGRIESDRLKLRKQAEALSDVTKASFRVGHRRAVTRAQFESDAQRRLARVQAGDEILTSKKERLGSLNSSLGAARTQLAKIDTQRESLMAQVSKIEAKIQETKAKQSVESEYRVNDSNLTEASKLLAGLNKRLDVDLKLIEIESPLLGDELIDTEVEQVDLSNKISSYLDGKAGYAGEAPEQEELAVTTAGIVR